MVHYQGLTSFFNYSYLSYLHLSHSPPILWGMTLSDFDLIIINSSGGKDSQTALREVMRQVREQGFDPSRVVVSHQDLGKVEWEGTRELAELQANHYGLKFVVSQYQNNLGRTLTLIDYAIARGKWPDNSSRWCTSEFKRSPGGRVITAEVNRVRAEMGLGRGDRPTKVLHVFGFRREESPNRDKLQPFAINKRQSNGKRQVFDWLPIHEWKERQVWDSVKASGVPSHPAYDLGMPRLSCVFCIFAPKPALMIAGKHNPDLLAEYVEAERRMGHTFKNGLALAEVQAAIESGETPGSMDGAWNM